MSSGVRLRGRGFQERRVIGPPDKTVTHAGSLEVLENEWAFFFSFFFHCFSGLPTGIDGRNSVGGEGAPRGFG